MTFYRRLGFVCLFTVFVMYIIDLGSLSVYNDVMIHSMNDQIRQEVRVALARANKKQSELADKLGISRQYLNSYLNGKAGDVPNLWQKVFDELGLELVVRPKDKDN